METSIFTNHPTLVPNQQNFWSTLLVPRFWSHAPNCWSTRLAPFLVPHAKILVHAFWSRKLGTQFFGPNTLYFWSRHIIFGPHQPFCKLLVFYTSSLFSLCLTVSMILLCFCFPNVFWFGPGVFLTFLLSPIWSFELL